MRMVRQLGREDWIAAGVRALSAGGVAAFRVEPVARSLGVTKGSFYWHFDDRAAWRDAVLSWWEHRAFAALVPRATNSPSFARSGLASFTPDGSQDEVIGTSDEHGEAPDKGRTSAKMRRFGMRVRLAKEPPFGDRTGAWLEGNSEERAHAVPSRLRAFAEREGVPQPSAMRLETTRPGQKASVSGDAVVSGTEACLLIHPATLPTFAPVRGTRPSRDGAMADLEAALVFWAEEDVAVARAVARVRRERRSVETRRLAEQHKEETHPVRDAGTAARVVAA